MDTQKQSVGKIGEEIATLHLFEKGFSIIDRNYWKPWGEIDIIAKKDEIWHFVEVKSVSCEASSNGKVNYDDYSPEDNVHEWKVRRLERAIQTYLDEKKVGEDDEWQIDIMAIFIDFLSKKAIIRITEDI
jgi:putative endonuclease